MQWGAIRQVNLQLYVLMCLLDYLFDYICRHIVMVEVQAILLSVVGQDTMCGMAVSHMYGG